MHGNYATRRTTSPPVHTTSLRGLKKIHTGKVRDIYEVDAGSMLIVTTDRLSAFDVVLPDPIPDKGRVLNSISNFWFERTAPHRAQPPHRPRRSTRSCSDPAERAMLADRAVIVKRLKTVPLEAVVRGYVIGSGWKDYQKTGAISGIKLPAGLEAGGETAADAVHAVDQGRARRARRDHQLRAGGATRGRGRSRRACATPRSRCTSSPPSTRASAASSSPTPSSSSRQDANGALVLIDEVLTPDSSRFWPADTYREGTSPPSFDKQFVRDYLETLDWNKKAPGPKLPPEIIAKTSAKYLEALEAPDRC